MVENQSNNTPTVHTNLSLTYSAKFVSAPDATLIYLIHGRAGNHKVMWTFARTLPTDVNVLSPQAQIPDPVLPHSPEGLSWWRIYEDKGNLLAKANHAAELVRQFTIEVEKSHNLIPKKRIAIGFSQGAAVVSTLLQSQPNYFNSVALLSGFAIEFPDRPQLDKFPVFLAHGSKDEIISMQRFERSVAYLQSLGCDIVKSIEEVGHKVGSTGMRALKEWLAVQA